MLFAVTAAAAMFNWYQWRGLKNDAHERDVVASVSQDFLLTLFDFTPDSIDRQVARIRASAVGDFATQVDQTFSASRVQQLKSAKVVSKSTIRSVFVERIAGDQATSFGVIDESVTNAKSPTPRTGVVRVELGLIDTTGGWRIGSVDILQTPGGTALPGG